MKRLLIYADVSVIGGCEDPEFASDSLALWHRFVTGQYVLALSAHTVRELQGAPRAVRDRLLAVPERWNFRHIVNLGRIRLFHSVNIAWGYGLLEIRSPREVLEYD